MKSANLILKLLIAPINAKTTGTKKLLVSISLILVLFGGLSVGLPARAAVLYFEPENAQISLGQEFSVRVKIDTEKECINTIKGEIKYDKNFLTAKEFLTGNSIISLWLKKPEIREGLISFSGGIPGGYCGKIPGDPGETNILGEIIFKVPKFLVSEKDIAEVRFLESSKVLLNNGLGTEADLKLKSAQYQILKERKETPEKILEREIKEDKIPPEPFRVLVLKDPQVFEGKYYIIFNTQDKQTGIDHYEVKEEKRNWKIAESPYLLEDQTLQSIIKVKAVDKAGNERIVEYKQKLSFFNRTVNLIKFLWGWLLRIIHSIIR